MIGQFIIHLLFGLSVASTVMYFLSWRKNNQSYSKIARTLFSMVSLLLIASASMLIVNIVRHNFEYTYVYSYSSINLPLHLQIASFYSGQEGSFLLWSTLVSLIGVFLIPYARRHDYENTVMMVFGLILCDAWRRSFGRPGSEPVVAQCVDYNSSANPLHWLCIHVRELRFCFCRALA